MVRDVARPCNRARPSRLQPRQPRAILRTEAHVEAEQIQAALARNDVYLQQFVEAFDLCPFARTCRERGRLFRQVLPGTADALTQAVHAAVLERQVGDPHVEVALLIVPQVGLPPRAFEAWTAQVTSAVAAGLRNRGQRLAFHIVAFHPDLPYLDDDPHRLIGLLRRSPDPTLQLVRTSVLDGVTASAEPVRYVAAEDLAGLDLATLERPPGLSDRIAQANLRTWRQHGEAMAAVLARSRT